MCVIALRHIRSATAVYLFNSVMSLVVLVLFFVYQFIACCLWIS